MCYKIKGIITANGNVGIGITSPAYKLDVNGNMNAQRLNLGNGDNLTWGGDYSSGHSTIAATDSSIGFYPGGGLEKVHFGANGNVGIGTATPTYKLDVSGTGKFSGEVIVPNGTSSSSAVNKGQLDIIATQLIVLGETSTTAYRGDQGKTAYNHSQTSGNPHNTTIGNINGLEIKLTKIPKAYSGITDTSGNYIIEFEEPYDNIPNIQVSITNNNSFKNSIKVTSITTGGFIVSACTRSVTPINGQSVLTATDIPISGIYVNVLITSY